mgnify:FL=1
MATDTKNFRVSEFACHCGCGYNNIDQRVINMAQTIREALGVPVKVNSGCRCVKHNAKVGGVKNSKHTKGLAADLSCSLGAVKMFETVKKLHSEGKLPNLDYCIRYRSWIHIDCGGKRKSLWEIKA